LKDPVTAPLDSESTHWGDGQKGGEVKRTNEGDGGGGVVIMDMVGEKGDWDLVRLIVGLNMGILAKVQQG
jgi:1-phosphatidylinositol phosphodiesterase